MSGRSLHLTVSLLALGALLSGAVAATLAQDAQTQTESVAAAARKAREAKKAAPKSKVITDDDLNKLPKTGADAVNVATPSASATQPASPAPAESATETPNQTTPSANDGAAKRAENPELAKLKAQIAQVKKELDLAKRELALDQDTFFSNPDHDHDTNGKAKLAGDQQQINEKQQELDSLNTRLAALLELEARKKKAAETAPAQPQ
jgi:hypothetical protein